MFQNGPHSIETQKILNVLAQARITLLNPQSKAEYDAQLQSRMLNREISSIPPPLPPSPPELHSIAPSPIINETNSFSPLSDEEIAIFREDAEDEDEDVIYTTSSTIFVVNDYNEWRFNR